MKTIDLRRQEVGLDELLRSIGAEAVRITSKEGDEFVLEAADAFEREVNELGRRREVLGILNGAIRRVRAHASCGY